VVFYLQAFVAYLKSVMMASNKKIFNVTQIDLDDFARLVTLLLQLLYTVCIVTLYNIIVYNCCVHWFGTVG